MTDIVERLLELVPYVEQQPPVEYEREVAGAMTQAVAEIKRLRLASAKANNEVCQTLGNVLGYPWFADDQKNFPGATTDDGVCVGNHSAQSLAMEAASEIKRLRTLNAEMVEVLNGLLACPAIADGGHDDPEWGCQESVAAAAQARATLAKAGGGEDGRS